MTKKIIHIAATVGLIGFGAAVFVILTANKPQLEKTKPPPPLPMVRATPVKIDTVAIPIRAEGTVRPLREISLIPEVSGRAVFVSPNLVDGGDFARSETLLKIDPVDYQLAVTLAEARVKDSESALQLAREEAAAAQEEWRLLNRDQPESSAPPPLVAKLPQLEAAEAKLAADRADLQKARLNLERTEIRAPFAGRVIEENVGLGQYVTSGQALATLFATEVVEIVVPLEDESLFWFDVPGFTPGEGPGSPATVKARIAGRDLTWTGRVDRAEGRLDAGTRLINVVIRVDDPYRRKPPLAVGLFVQVEISGRRLPDTAIIPRSALRSNNIVWVVDDAGMLSFRQVKVARLFPDVAYVSEGLQSGEMIVTSPIKTVTDGMRVRIGRDAGGNAS
jgi:RND family efflux transporter MFP subunit